MPGANGAGRGGQFAAGAAGAAGNGAMGAAGAGAGAAGKGALGAGAAAGAAGAAAGAAGAAAGAAGAAAGAAGAAAGAMGGARGNAGRPGISDVRTEHLTPASGANGSGDAYPREPQLLTHRETGYAAPDPYDYDDHDGFDGYDDEPLSEEEERMARRKKMWRRIRRTSYVLVAAGFLLPIIAFGIAYMFVKVPDPAEVAAGQKQPITLLSADGQPIYRVAGPDTRTMVTYQQVPEQVRHAVEGAEDATFDTNPGFDWHAIVRAVWIQVGGGSSGGSGITQQYVKQATGNQQHTLTRKFVELVQAFKMNNQEDKQTIVTAYLNTVYFGRGATGIQSAAKAYFNKDVGQLNASEAALLGGLIQRPGTWDQSYAEGRWRYVMDQMVQHNLITPDDRAKYPNFPQPVPAGSSNSGTLKTASADMIYNMVVAELNEKGFSTHDAQTRGFNITTTINLKYQQNAEDAANKVIFNGKQPDYLRTASVSIDPKTGSVVSYYGGSDRYKDPNNIDFASSMQEPGSSFKPYDLAASLMAGKATLDSTYDGTTPQLIEGKMIANSDHEGANEPAVTVKAAMTESLNTVFAKMVSEVGANKVAAAAHAAGIPPTVKDYLGKDQPTLRGDGPQDPPDINIAIGGGGNRIRPIDQAAGYATFANNGMAIKPHFIKSVKDANGNMVFDNSNLGAGDPAFDKSDPSRNAQIARNVTEAMTDVAAHSKIGWNNGRPVASKSGTHEYAKPDGSKNDENSKAWYAGYTPQLVTAVWVGTPDYQPIYGSYPLPLRGKTGKHAIYGSDEPGSMWEEIMNADLTGQPVLQFMPKYKELGTTTDHSGHLTTTEAPPPPTTTQDKPSTTIPTPTETTDTPSDTPTRTSKHRPPTTTSCVSIFCGPTTQAAQETTNSYNYGAGPPPNQ